MAPVNKSVINKHAYYFQNDIRMLQNITESQKQQQPEYLKRTTL